MKNLSSHRRSSIIISLIVFSILLLTECINNSKQKIKQTHDGSFEKFAGSQSCANCHKDIYEKHIHTEHHLSSAIANEKNILGSFSSGSNVFIFDPATNVTMEKRDSVFYQVEYINGSEVKKGRFDIVVGSGRKGQSYLNWLGDRLVQLPITYFSPAGQWSNSPGYPPQKVAFYRPITSRCLECHSTYFEKTSDSSDRFEKFDRNKVIYAVECEKCHGPAAEHVKFQSQNPTLKQAKYIVNPGKLSRERILDLCTLCHGGPLTKTKPSFSFQAGDTLSNYFSLPARTSYADNIDVHGNQMGLLSFSKCFTVGSVTCINCHNIHENERDEIRIFSQRCMNCHGQGHGTVCKLTKQIGPPIKEDCIDCHMPKQLSHAVAVYLQGADVPTPALMRTHYVKIYPDQSQKVLALLKKKK